MQMDSCDFMFVCAAIFSLGINLKGLCDKERSPFTDVSAVSRLTQTTKKVPKMFVSKTLLTLLLEKKAEDSRFGPVFLQNTDVEWFETSRYMASCHPCYGLTSDP